MRKIFTRYTLLAFFLVPLLSLGQNLVPNYSFENCTGYPSSSGQYYLLQNWTNPNGGSPDYNHVLGGANAGVPNNMWGSQAARTGQAYVALARSSGGSYYEYLQVQLTSPLTVGQNYYCEMYVSSVENYYNRGMTYMGFSFRPSPTSVGGSSLISAPMQVYSTTPVCDMTNWVQISGTFTATSADQYLIIGNTMSNAVTTWCTYAGSGSIATAMYFVEDVVVQPAVVLAMDMAGQQAKQVSPLKVEVSWELSNDASASHYIVQRSKDGNSFADAGKVEAKGAEGLQSYRFEDLPQDFSNRLWYRIKQVEKDGTVHFGEAMEVDMSVDAGDYLAGIYPNPVAKGDVMNLTVLHEGTGGNAVISIYDMSGRMLNRQQFPLAAGMNTLRPEISGLPAGSYLLHIAGSGLNRTERLVITP